MYTRRDKNGFMRHVKTLNETISQKYRQEQQSDNTTGTQSTQQSIGATGYGVDIGCPEDIGCPDSLDTNVGAGHRMSR
jgi:hypothetical protein